MGPDGVARVRLYFYRFDEAGDYTGRLPFPADQGGPVALTVRVRDHVGWAIATLLAGVGFALAFEYYAGVLRPIWLADDARLVAAAKKADEKFAAACKKLLGDTSLACGYTIAAGVAARVDELRGGLLRFTRDPLSRIPAGDAQYTAVTAGIAGLQAFVAEWPAFATDLVKLQSAIAAARKDAAGRAAPPPPPGEDVRKEPALCAAAEADLEGRALTAADVPAVRADVVALTDRLTRWREADVRRVAVARTVDALRGELPKLDAARGAAAQALVTTAEQHGSAAWVGLWEGTTAAAFDAAVAQHLAPAEEMLNLLRSLLSQATATTPATPTGAGATLAAAAARPLGPPPRASTPARPGRGWGSWVWRLSGLRSGADVVALAIVVGLALSSGLATLYFDKPFGRAQDYLAALVWGAGSRVAVTTLSATVQLLTRLPVLGRTFGGPA